MYFDARITIQTLLELCHKVILSSILTIHAVEEYLAYHIGQAIMPLVPDQPLKLTYANELDCLSHRCTARIQELILVPEKNKVTSLLTGVFVGWI
jgi:hypothetical protein